jgi:hypothetical protein
MLINCSEGRPARAEKNRANWFVSLVLLALLCLLAFIVISPADPNRNLPLIDSSAFMYSGRRLLNGAHLYDQVWDNKPPLIHFINALGMFLGDQTPWGIWFLDFLSLIIGIFIAYRLLSGLWGPMIASIGVFLGYLALRQVYCQGNTVEGFSLPFTWLGLLAFFSLLKKPDQKLKWLLLGACLAVNFFYRANNTATLLVAIAVLLLQAWRRNGFIAALRNGIFAFSGFFLFALPLLAFFLSQGNLKALWEATIIYNFAYSAPGPPFLQRVFSQAILTVFKLFMPTFIFVSGGLAFSVYDLFKKESQESALAALLVLGFIAEIAFSSISARNYTHYYISWCPIMTLLIAYFFARLLQHWSLSAAQGQTWRSLAVNTFLLLTLLIAFRAEWMPTLKSLSLGLRQGWPSATRHDELSIFLAENTQPDDLVWTLAGGVRPNLLANRNSIDGALSYPQLQKDPIGLAQQDRIFENLIRQRPAVVVDASGVYPDYPAINPAQRALQSQTFAGHHNLYAVLDYLWENYELWAEVDQYLLYRIKTP